MESLSGISLPIPEDYPKGRIVANFPDLKLVSLTDGVSSSFVCFLLIQLKIGYTYNLFLVV